MVYIDNDLKKKTNKIWTPGNNLKSVRRVIE